MENSADLGYPQKEITLRSGTMAFVDVGNGETILFVHGTPTYSYVYRNHIAALSANYRCIAIDHLGFGNSEKNKEFDGSPEWHSKNLEEFISKLGLESVHLVVHDFGGPIGLNWAVGHPEQVKSLTLFNTWAWSTKEHPDAKKIDAIINSFIGKLLYLNLNFSAKVLLKKGFANPKNLSKKLHQKYLNPFRKKAHRYGPYQLAKALVGSSSFYASIHSKLSNLSEKPVLIQWGTKDEFLKEAEMNEWLNIFPQAKLITYEVGHFVQEEASADSIAGLKLFLDNTK